MHPTLFATVLGTSAALSLACAIPRSAGESVSIPVSVTSHNRSSVDVYLLCGDRDAQWLGVVHGKDGGLFEIPVTRTRCARGLNFFLVHRDQNRGYWVGPLRPRRGSIIHLTIEKYAGLSTALVTLGG
jgi:hypothetical protein